MNLIELFNVMNVLYAVTGAVFFGGAGVVMFAFGISYVSQKAAMWVDVVKIVKHRNALIEEVKQLQARVAIVEELTANENQSGIVAPIEIGVQTVVPIKP